MNIRPTVCMLLAVLAVATARAQEPSAQLKVQRDASGDVIVSVTGTVRACGLTALNDGPTVHTDGNRIEIVQPVAGVACMNPPPMSKPYAHSVNLGRLAAGTYAIHWTFPDLRTTYTAPDR